MALASCPFLAGSLSFDMCQSTQEKPVWKRSLEVAKPLEARSARCQLGRALAHYRAACAYLHATVGRAFEQAPRVDAFDMRKKAELGPVPLYVVRRILADADRVVISHHAFGSEVRFASAAQAYWDLDVDFPVLTMD